VIGESSHMVHSLSKRSATKSAKDSPQGAALVRSIKLVYNDDITDNNGQGGIRRDASDDGSSSLSMKWVLIVVITVCFILLVAVIVLMMLYRRKSRPVTTKVVEPGEQMQGTEV
jgi:CHASE3 domain sensor protein